MSSRVLVLAATAALGCAVPFLSPISEALPERPPKAQLAVELIQGFTGRPVPAPPRPERVEVLIDVTASMKTATEPGPGRYVAARNAPYRANPCTCPGLADLLRSSGFNVLLCILKGFALSRPLCWPIKRA